MANEEKVTNWVTLIVAFAGLMPVVIELLNEESTNTSGLILFISIFILVAFYFVYTFIWTKIRDYTNQIEANTEHIKNLENVLDYKQDFYSLEKRLSILEVKNGKKRGN